MKTVNGDGAAWRTTRAAGIACASCGKAGTCTVSPDGTAFKCWKDGGRVHQSASNGRQAGTGYVGRAHRPKPAKKTHATPEDAAAAAAATVRNGTPAGAWSYHRANGAEVMRVLRFDTPDDGKEFRPIHRNKAGAWRLGDPDGLLPLYRLPEIARASAVAVCEGEKAADAACSVGLAATTSAHGSSSAEKTDWTAVAGKDVTIFPDNDVPGTHYARAVAGICLKLDPPATVRIVTLPDLPDGGDFVEHLEARDAWELAAIVDELDALTEAAPAVDPSDYFGGPVLTCLADVEPSQVSWLWPGRIPLGRMTLLVGRPGEGKSFATCDWVARVTTGTPWPDGTECPIGSAILICAEDDAGDTIRPRLDAHYADVSRVHLLSAVRRIGDDGARHDVMFTLEDVAALEAALKKVPDCKLIVVDPIGSFLGGETDSHRDNEVRSVLAPVGRLAEKYGAAVVVVAHRRKSSGSSADDLALGSRAFTGIARAVWHLSRDSEVKNRRLLLPGKNNLAPEGDGLAFTIQGDPPAIVWERDPVTMSADDALAVENDGGEKPGPDPHVRTQAETWLAKLLAAAPIPARQVEQEAKDAGISWATVRRAADGMKVVRGEKCPASGKYVWRLPAGAALQAAQENIVSNLSNLSNQLVFSVNAAVSQPEQPASQLEQPEQPRRRRKSSGRNLSNHDPERILSNQSGDEEGQGVTDPPKPACSGSQHLSNQGKGAA